MQKSLLSLLVTSLLTGLVLTVGCGQDTTNDVDATGNNSTATNADVEASLQSLDALLEGAPDNDELPEEGKADAQYPSQFFDLTTYQSPVKSQGGRGVCSIFSTVALMEHLYLKEGTIADPDFSEQYLQWSAKYEVRSFLNTSGSNANYNLQAISEYGIVEENYWPYESRAWGASDDPACAGSEAQRPTRCYTNGAPPEEALNAQKWTLPKGRWVSTRARDLKAFMYNNQQAIVAGMSFYYQSWNHSGSSLRTNQEYWRNGYVLYPNEEDKKASKEKPAGHSILLVGWDDELEVQLVDGDGELVFDENGEPVTEKGFFIFKNSWGTGSFGVNNPHGDGYGFLSMRYMEEFGNAYASNLPILDTPTEPEEPEEEICGQTLSCEDERCAEESICETGVTIYTHEVEVGIPDNDPAGLKSTINVDDEGQSTGVFVTVAIEHPFVGDLQIELVHPDGDTVRLKEADKLPGRDLVTTYTVRDFIGKDINGTWTLVVSDLTNLDSGALFAWELELVR